jgi:hypothetical protein
VRPEQGTIAPDDPRVAMLDAHLPVRAGLTPVRPAPGRIAESDERRETIAEHLIDIPTKKDLVVELQRLRPAIETAIAVANQYKKVKDNQFVQQDLLSHDIPLLMERLNVWIADSKPAFNTAFTLNKEFTTSPKHPTVYKMAINTCATQYALWVDHYQNPVEFSWSYGPSKEPLLGFLQSLESKAGAEERKASETQRYQGDGSV